MGGKKPLWSKSTILYTYIIVVILKTDFSAAWESFENDRWFIFVLCISKLNFISFSFILWVLILVRNPTFRQESRLVLSFMLYKQVNTNQHWREHLDGTWNELSFAITNCSFCPSSFRMLNKSRIKTQVNKQRIWTDKRASRANHFVFKIEKVLPRWVWLSG